MEGKGGRQKEAGGRESEGGVVVVVERRPGTHLIGWNMKCAANSLGNRPSVAGISLAAVDGDSGSLV